MSDLKAYLAQKYMSGPKADAILSRTAPKKKKRKKGENAAASSSMVRDEDAGLGWVAEPTKEEDDDLDIADAVVEKDRGFKKRKVDESGWKTIREPSPPPAEDEQPLLVDDPSSSFTGGLVSAKNLKKVLPGAKPVEPMDVTAEEIALAQETVYRDAEGKKIDTKAARAEAARLKRLKEEQEAKKMEWGKGLVQREEEEKRKQQLEKNRTSKFARHADDKDLNEEQKSKELWNDPAAAFLSKKRAKGPRKPEYTGPTPPPNRFGIKPGYRWDGVDRGTGFEKKLFQSKNERKRKGAESHQWSTEDM
ncbi:Pre-mRNA-splicing factor of RES complex-domain-containing protein [Mycena floridula]|nr:Pre-mRNA-splicing factor of RES complex-domain-containing protein [Mycena floridula]